MRKTPTRPQTATLPKGGKNLRDVINFALSHGADAHYLPSSGAERARPGSNRSGSRGAGGPAG